MLDDGIRARCPAEADPYRRKTALLIFLRDLAFSNRIGPLNCEIVSFPTGLNRLLNDKDKKQLSTLFSEPTQLFQGRRLLLHGLDVLQVPPRVLFCHGDIRWKSPYSGEEKLSVYPQASSATFSSYHWAARKRAAWSEQHSSPSRSPEVIRELPDFIALASVAGGNSSRTSAWSLRLLEAPWRGWSSTHLPVPDTSLMVRYTTDFYRKESKAMWVSLCFSHCSVGKDVNQFRGLGSQLRWKGSRVSQYSTWRPKFPTPALVASAALSLQGALSPEPVRHPLVLAKLSWHRDLGFTLLTPEMNADLAQTAQGCADVSQGPFLLPPCFNQSQTSPSQFFWL
ncbi:uncharacterized protein LOC116582392 [Mustela erminea]|uniref:uncharacterized protein LOC116582392 n=1 Tax=Mustela erminea TaxID=36723 RepID=UPI001387174E|nr:uncharacterized protein LOC116582392 [Mustela erminea]